MLVQRLQARCLLRSQVRLNQRQHSWRVSRCCFCHPLHPHHHRHNHSHGVHSEHHDLCVDQSPLEGCVACRPLSNISDTRDNNVEVVIADRCCSSRNEFRLSYISRRGDGCSHLRDQQCSALFRALFASFVVAFVAVAVARLAAQ